MFCVHHAWPQAYHALDGLRIDTSQCFTTGVLDSKGGSRSYSLCKTPNCTTFSLLLDVFPHMPLPLPLHIITFFGPLWANRGNLYGLLSSCPWNNDLAEVYTLSFAYTSSFMSLVSSSQTSMLGQ